MKKYIFLAGLLILAGVISAIFYISKPANAIVWHEYSGHVFEQAKKDHRQVILFGQSDTCPWCQQMEKVTFSDNSVVSLINANYFPVILDVNKYIDAAIKYQMMDLPTVVIFDINGKPTKTITGYIGPSDMIKNLK